LFDVNLPDRFVVKTTVTDSFILGLSTGSACLMTCGMVMFPYLMSGSAGVRRITADLSMFLLSRLIVYLILAVASWYFGKALFVNQVVKSIVPGILYIVFAGMLIWYAVDRNRQKDCPAKFVTTVNNRRLIPIFLGVVNSLGFCPALFLILTKGASEASLAKSFAAFLAFFIGSSLWFLPLPLAGKIKRKKVLETVGILATGLAGIIFIIKGITNLIGGIING
jgi:sulfite exporter TauE/SafE